MIDRSSQPVALGGRHELGRGHFVALLIDHLDHGIEDPFVTAGQADDRLMYEPEAVFRQSRFDLVYPQSVEPLDARALVRGFFEHDSIAASFAAELVGHLGVFDQLLHQVGTVAHFCETDRAGDGDRVTRHFKNVAGNTFYYMVGPRFDITQAAAFEHDGENRAAESSGEIVGLQ